MESSVVELFTNPTMVTKMAKIPGRSGVIESEAGFACFSCLTNVVTELLYGICNQFAIGTNYAYSFF